MSADGLTLAADRAEDMLRKLVAQNERIIAHLAEKIAPRLLTVEQAGVYIGRTKRAVEHMIARGELFIIQAARDSRVHLDRSDLDRWIEANRLKR